MNESISKPSHRWGPLAVSALRSHRAIHVRRYPRGGLSLWVGLGLYGLTVALLGGGGYFLPLVWSDTETQRIVGLVIGVGIPTAVALYVLYLSFRARAQRAETNRRVAALRTQSARFSGAVGEALGARPVTDKRLAPTVRFLDAHGVGPVPLALLRRLFGKEERRLRIEGEVDGAPCMIVVVVGRAITVIGGGLTGISEGARGPHLFTVVAGAREQGGAVTAPAGFEAFDTETGTTWVRALEDELPAPSDLVAMVRAAGPRRHPIEWPSPAPAQTFSDPREPVEAFLDALVAGDAVAALAPLDPVVFGHLTLEIEAVGLREWMREWGLSPSAFEFWPNMARSPRVYECVAQLTLPDGEHPLRIQTQRGTGKTWRITFIQDNAHYIGSFYGFDDDATPDNTTFTPTPRET